MQRNTIFLACFFICVNCFSQQYPFVHYTPKDGLVSSRVKKSYQDSKGRMYFLTTGGLSVFDGARFRNYTTQNGLANNLVNDILEVGDDSLLVACNTHILLALVKGKLVTIKTEGAPCPLINQFYKHENDRIYLSSDDGLFLLEKNTIHALNISRITEEQRDAPFLGNITGDGNFLIITTNEMRFNKGIYAYDIKADQICDAVNIGGFLLGKDRKNRIWFSITDKLLIVDQNALQKGKLLMTDPRDGYQQVKNYSTFVLTFDNDAIWVVFRNKEFRNSEIRRISDNGTVFSMPLPEQATISYIKNIFVDRENTIWLSNDGEGVFKIINSPLQVFEKLFGQSESSTSNTFYSKGNTWYSTTTNKMFRRSANRLDEYNCNLHVAPHVFNESGNKILAFDGQNIYKGNFQHQKKTIEFQKIISLPDSDFFTKRVVIDKNGVVISSQNTGVSVWVNKKMIFHLAFKKNELAEELFFDKNGRLWIVKRSDGITVYDLRPENPSQYLQPVSRYEKKEILGSPRSFVIDKKGFIWIGTRDDGIVGYEQKNNRLKQVYHFYSGNGLTDNFVTALACDSLNNIIVGTETGLDRILFDSTNSMYRVENLSRSSNFFGYITQAWADSKQAYALTPSGVVLQVSPTVEIKTNNTPELLLEEMRVNARIVAGKTKFNHDENNISFFVAAPSFIDEKQITYSYLLEGSGNKQWSDTASANSIINLTNLSPAKYTLKIKAFFPSSRYQPSELCYSFEISPPWWQTWWFRSITALLIIAVIILGFRFYYKRRLEKQMILLEKQQAIEKERTRIATDMHDDLGAGLSRIKFLSQSMLNKKVRNEAIKTELEKITSFSDEMSEKMGEIVWALNEKNDTLADLIAYTRSYAVEYLQSHNIQCEANTPLNLPSTFITGEMRRHIFLSVKECLHNIVKHSGATKVFFAVELANRMQIVIHDNGKGIDRDNQRMFSNGLDNIENRMKEINGKASFINDKGTKVLLSVPLIL